MALPAEVRRMHKQVLLKTPRARPRELFRLPSPRFLIRLQTLKTTAVMSSHSPTSWPRHAHRAGKIQYRQPLNVEIRSLLRSVARFVTHAPLQQPLRELPLMVERSRCQRLLATRSFTHSATSPSTTSALAMA